MAVEQPQFWPSNPANLAERLFSSRSAGPRPFRRGVFAPQRSYVLSRYLKPGGGEGPLVVLTRRTLAGRDQPANTLYVPVPDVEFVVRNDRRCFRTEFVRQQSEISCKAAEDIWIEFERGHRLTREARQEQICRWLASTMTSGRLRIPAPSSRMSALCERPEGDDASAQSWYRPRSEACVLSRWGFWCANRPDRRHQPLPMHRYWVRDFTISVNGVFFQSNLWIWTESVPRPISLVMPLFEEARMRWRR